MIPNKNISKKEWIMTIVFAGIIVIILFLLESYYHWVAEKYPLTISSAIAMIIGILSAIAVLYFQERLYKKGINLYYASIEGRYKRVDIGQDNTSEQEIQNIKLQNDNLIIKLKHIKGTHTLECFADYWKSNNAKVKATIEFNEINGNTASGRYLYTMGDGYVGQTGTYKIYRLEEDKTKLLVLYHHLFPRTRDYNPEKNRGWEIWQKQ